MSEPTEPVVGLVVPDTYPCNYVPGETRRIDCACNECLAFARNVQAVFDKNFAALENIIKIGPRESTVDEVEIPIGFAIGEPVTEAELLWRYAQYVLDCCAGNKSKAARMLGIDRRSLYRRLR